MIRDHLDEDSKLYLKELDNYELSIFYQRLDFNKKTGIV